MNKFWTIKNEADAPEAEIYLYGEISADAQLYKELFGDEEMKSAKMFADDLNALEGKNVLLRINSPGGDVFQAQAMYSLLQAYPGNVTCHIDGVCASAATVVACAADKIIMPQNGLFMIHNPSVGIVDNMTAADLERLKSVLDKVAASILTVYERRCGEKTPSDDLIKLMDSETWLDAKEALERGFVDEVDEYDVAASLTDSKVLMINGLAMPGMKAYQKEILDRLKPRKEEVKNVADKALVERILDFLNGNQDVKAADEAATKEKERLEALDAMKGENAYVNALVDVAKAQNKTVEELKPFVEAVEKVRPENKAFEELKTLIQDQLHSGAEGVKPQIEETAEMKAAAKRQAGIDAVVSLVNGKRG